MIKSPLRYPGGKNRAIDLISTLVPNYVEFREPFVGGGSLFVHLKQKYPNRKYWINDLHYSLFKFWEKCKTNVDDVINQVLIWRQEFENGKELHRFLTGNIEKFNCIEKASAFFVFNRITFSGTSESGGYSEAAYKGRFTDSSIRRVKELSSILNNTKITNLDYRNVVEVPGEDVFIFLDPPYYSATKSSLYGKNGNLHKSFDHYRFAEVMKNCNHKWLITYDDCEFIRNLFSFGNIISWNLTYGMRNQTPTSNQKGKELFISNYLERLPGDNQLSFFFGKKDIYMGNKKSQLK